MEPLEMLRFTLGSLIIAACLWLVWRLWTSKPDSLADDEDDVHGVEELAAAGLLPHDGAAESGAGGHVTTGPAHQPGGDPSVEETPRELDAFALVADEDVFVPIVDSDEDDHRHDPVGEWDDPLVSSSVAPEGDSVDELMVHDQSKVETIVPDRPAVAADLDPAAISWGDWVDATDVVSFADEEDAHEPPASLDAESPSSDAAAGEHAELGPTAEEITADPAAADRAGDAALDDALNGALDDAHSADETDVEGEHPANDEHDTAATLSRAQRRAQRRAARREELEQRKNAAKQRRAEIRARRAARAHGDTTDAAAPEEGTDTTLWERASVPSVEQAPEPAAEDSPARDEVAAAAEAGVQETAIEADDPWVAAAASVMPTDVERSPVREQRERRRVRRRVRSSEDASSAPVAPSTPPERPFATIPFADPDAAAIHEPAVQDPWAAALVDAPVVPADIPPAPISPAAPSEDPWSSAAIAQTWSTPAAQVTIPAEDDVEIDHHAYGLPEPLPPRRQAVLAEA